MSTSTTLSLRGRATRRDHAVLTDVDLAARHGERIGLVGPNGSGKSTLLGLLAGVLQAPAQLTVQRAPGVVVGCSLRPEAPAPASWSVGRTLRAMCRRHGLPDVLVLSKALTNGTCAASALLLGDRVGSALDLHGDVLSHGETQAGARSAGAPGLVVVDAFFAAGLPALPCPVVPVDVQLGWPPVAAAQALAQLLGDSRTERVLAVGGGFVLDLAKLGRACLDPRTSRLLARPAAPAPWSSAHRRPRGCPT